MDRKLISEKEVLKEIKVTPAVGEEPEPRVVHHIELTSRGPGSAWTGTLTSTIQRRAAAGKQMCNVCQQAVRLPSASETGCAEDEDGEDEGLKCRSCCRVRHFKCDALSRLEFSSLKTVSRRYICSSCLDLAIKSWKETSHVPSIGSTCQMDPAAVLQPENGSTATKGLKETEVIPSKEEMKQMIREVVDDVIRSTISQVINQKVLVSCNACSTDSSGSGCECKVLPSVTSLDKQAEEETKKTKSEDLLLLLKSPDVEVKHFLPSSKSTAAAESHDQIVTSRDIELQKRQILDLVSLKSEERKSTACTRIHVGNQGREYGDDDGSNKTVSSEQCSVRRSNGGDERQDYGRERDDLQDEIAETGEDIPEEGADDDDDDLEDAGEYESIRFDRQDLESKACLGFAQLDPLLHHKSGASLLANEPEDQSDTKSAMPIKLNQLDLSKFIRSVSVISMRLFLCSSSKLNFRPSAIPN